MFDFLRQCSSSHCKHYLSKKKYDGKKNWTSILKPTWCILKRNKIWCIFNRIQHWFIKRHILSYYYFCTCINSKTSWMSHFREGERLALHYRQISYLHIPVSSIEANIFSIAFKLINWNWLKQQGIYYMGFSLEEINENSNWI